MVQEKKFWAFEEAEKILEKFGNKKEIIFETGYGPSGLPHIGTFGEVLRTTAIANSLKKIAPSISTKIIAVSDDMDGLRKIPDNVPNKEMLIEHLGKPLTSIPDPFGTHQSYGHHMNSLLCGFLDLFNFKYEFKSSTYCYQSGLYDEQLLLLLKNYDKVMDIMLPTLGEERQKTYSPFLPICPKTQKVLQVPIIKTNPELGTITYKNENEEIIETLVTGGRCKLQWKPDWGMRWAALNVHYEAHGKDLKPSADLSSEICKILEKEPPILFCYELFLDGDGKKISKSKGNGISMEDWLKYAPQESLSFYLLQNPKQAKKLYFDIIPRSTDDYLDSIKQYNIDKNHHNHVWHIHNGNVPSYDMSGISFTLLLNLATVCNAENEQILWEFIKNYKNDISPKDNKFLSKLVVFSVKYYHDFVKPKKSYKTPNENEKSALVDLADSLKSLPHDISAEDIQKCIFEIGKVHYKSKLKDWFKALYEILLGQTEGPRIGSFFKIYGIKNTINLIENITSKN